MRVESTRIFLRCFSQFYIRYGANFSFFSCAFHKKFPSSTGSAQLSVSFLLRTFRTSSTVLTFEA